MLFDMRPPDFDRMICAIQEPKRLRLMVVSNPGAQNYTDKRLSRHRNEPGVASRKDSLFPARHPTHFPLMR